MLTSLSKTGDIDWGQVTMVEQNVQNKQSIVTTGMTIMSGITAIIGDSGAPVGKVSGGDIDIYGIHKGNSLYGGYEAYVPYDNIKSYLNLQ